MWYKNCDLCITEKYIIARADQKTVSPEQVYRIYFQMSPSKQIPLEKRQIMIFKVVSYFNCLIVMLTRTINNSIEKCDSNLSFVVTI